MLLLVLEETCISVGMVIATAAAFGIIKTILIRLIVIDLEWECKIELLQWP